MRSNLGQAGRKHGYLIYTKPSAISLVTWLHQHDLESCSVTTSTELCQDSAKYWSISRLTLMPGGPRNSAGTPSPNGQFQHERQVPRAKYPCFRTTVVVPLRGQTTWNLSRLSPKRDCGLKGVKSEGYSKWGTIRFKTFREIKQGKSAGHDRKITWN